MTNEFIKQLLLQLEHTDSEFSVTMTGKESRRVNGLYKPDTHEIILHNKNFKNDNALIYTAIHEYTHHLINAEHEKDGTAKAKGAKVHDTVFWAKMDDLLEAAVSKGIYTRDRSEKLAGLIEEARQIDHEIATLKKKLGKLLSEIHKISDDEGVRFEDVLSHDIKMQKTTAEKCVRSSLIEQDGIGQDTQEALAKSLTKSSSVKAAVEKAVKDGKSVEQLKRTIQEPKPGNEDRYTKLQKEKARLEKTIAGLNERLSIVCEALETL